MIGTVRRFHGRLMTFRLIDEPDIFDYIWLWTGLQ